MLCYASSCHTIQSSFINYRTVCERTEPQQPPNYQDNQKAPQHMGRPAARACWPLCVRPPTALCHGPLRLPQTAPPPFSWLRPRPSPRSPDAVASPSDSLTLARPEAPAQRSVAPAGACDGALCIVMGRCVSRWGAMYRDGPLCIVMGRCVLWLHMATHTLPVLLAGIIVAV